MKRLTSILAFVFFLYNFAIAQQPKPTRPVISDRSSSILKNMKNKWIGLSSVKIAFTLQSSENGKSYSPVSGNIWIKDKSYKLIIPGQNIICNGKNVWTYLPENKEVSINPYEENSDGIPINPIKLIGSYDKYYSSAFIKESAEKGIAIQIIDLYPKYTQAYYKIRLVISKDKQLPLRAIIYNKNGSSDTYYFNQITFNPNLNSDFFTFDAEKYPQVEIIDMR